MAKWKSNAAIRSRILRQVGRNLNSIRVFEPDTQKYVKGELIDAACKLSNKVLEGTQTRDMLQVASIVEGVNVYSQATHSRDIGVHITDPAEYDTPPENWPINPHTAGAWDNRDRLIKATALLISEIERLDTMMYDVADHGFDALDKETLEDSKKSAKLKSKYDRKMYKTQQPVDISSIKQYIGSNVTLNNTSVPNVNSTAQATASP